MFFIGALPQVVFISAPCPIPNLCPCAAYSLSHKSAGIAIPLMRYHYCTAPGLYRTCCSWQLFAVFSQVFAFRKFAPSARPLMRFFFYWGSAPNPACSRRSQPIPDLLLFARFRPSSKSAASARPLMRPCFLLGLCPKPCCTAPGLYRTCCYSQLFAFFQQVLHSSKFAPSARPLMRPCYQ